jgi:hypothetical protein
VKRTLTIAAVLIGTMLVGCTQNQVIVSLETAATAAIAVAPAIETAASVPAGTQTVIGNYLVLVSECLNSASTVIGANPPATLEQEAVAIGAACAANVGQSPVLPAGTPANIVAAVKTVASTIQALLSALPKTAASANAMGIVPARPAGVPVHVDASKLNNVNKALVTLGTQLPKLRGR